MFVNAEPVDIITSDKPSAIIKRKYTGLIVKLLDGDLGLKRRRVAKTITKIDPQIERKELIVIPIVRYIS